MFYISKKNISKNNACMKILVPEKDIEISIAFDDSCGGMENLSRIELKLFKISNPNEDVTNNILNMNELHFINFEDVINVYNLVKNRI